MNHNELVEPYIVACGALDPQRELPPVRLFLQHVLDHDSHLPIGEHIFLKLKAQAEETPFSFEGCLKSSQECALALLAFTNVEQEEEEFPGYETEMPGRLVGYLQLLAQPTANPSRLMVELTVHPHRRHEGIGSHLFEAASQLARQHGFKNMDLWAYHFQKDSPAHRFADRLGLQCVRELLHLRRPSFQALPEVTVPAGYKLRSFRPGLDDEEWLELNRQAFAGHPENGSWSLTDLRLRFEQPWFDPRDFLILEDSQGRMAAFHWTKLHSARFTDLYASPAYFQESRSFIPPAFSALVPETVLGEVYVVGVHPRLHGQGLGRIMTVLGLEHLKQRGATIFGLYVDGDNGPALNLYYSLGFRLHHADFAYRLEL